MKVRYVNQQDKSDPMNGIVVTRRTQLIEMLNARRTNAPFFARFSGDSGFKLMVGIGGGIGCVQYSPSNGEPPYLMAVSPHPPMKRGYAEFLVSDTLTPVAARYIISFDEVKKIVVDFLETGERSNAVSWQALNPRAAKEDAERQSDL